MMNTNKTELVFIMDKSGSMGGLEADTIGGYNAMLAKQKKEAGEAVVTTMLFDDTIELLHDRITVNGIAPLTETDYEVGGMTALLDAIGSTIHKISHVQKQTSETERAGKVLFVITTDGMENASREYGYDKIKSMIEHQKEMYGWEFIFLGANIDAVSTAAQFGIQEEYAVKYHADSEGTQVNFEAVSEAVSSVRQGRKVDRTWKESIEMDFERRKR